MKKIFIFVFLCLGLLVIFLVFKNYTKTSNSKQEKTIFIGQSIKISKNQTVIIPGTDIKLKIQLIEIPGTNCRDCLTLINLKLEKNGQIQNLIFRSGGIAGVIVDQINGFGYTFKLKSFEENEISLMYYKIQI